MKIFSVIILLLSLSIILTGCEGSSSSSNNSPSGMSHLERAHSDALNIINNVLLKENKNPVSVPPANLQMHPGVDQGYYQWIFNGSAGHYVSRTKTIHIGHNPNDINDFHYNTLVHECGHHILYVSYDILDHDARFDDLPLWKKSRDAFGYAPLLPK
jgi:hypothetical protein